MLDCASRGYFIAEFAINVDFDELTVINTSDVMELTVVRNRVCAGYCFYRSLNVYPEINRSRR